MKVLERVLDFYINSSIHVALSVFSLAWITLLEFHLPYDEHVLYFIFYASITGYNFVKFFGLAKFHHRSLAKRLKSIQIFSFACFILLCFYAFKLEFRTFLYISIFAAVTFLYAIPFFPKRMLLDDKHNLRSIGGIKVYIIALVWAGVTVFLPLINADFNINSDVIITTIQRFILVVVLMLPFEIRDLNYDSLKLSTIPQNIGVKNTKTLGVILLIFFFFLGYFKDEVDVKRLIILLVITFVILLFLVFARKNQGKYYSSFWVESIPVIWLILLLFL